jgi:cellulase/cellobiase CelA1
VCTLKDRGQSSFIGWEDEACPIISFCLIMSVSTCFSLVDNLAHNATRLSLSNEPFLLNHVFLCVHDVPSYK